MKRVSPDLRIQTFERFDGSIWRQYETEGYRYLLTGAGRRLLTRRHMSRMFQPYVGDYVQQREGVSDTRKFFAEGGNARLFSLGDDIVVKESMRTSGSSLFASLDRMDRLIAAVEKHCPRWIDVPTHYGAAISRSDMRKQFLVEQKVDHGVTVGDIMHPGEVNRSTEGGLAFDALDNFGPISPELTEEVLGRYASLQRELMNAVVAEDLDPERYLPDIATNPYNVVLERLAAPLAESAIKYWVIDQ